MGTGKRMTHEMARMLNAAAYAVVGASRQPEKYGSIVYRTLKAAGKAVYAVNPHADTVDGDPCFATLADVPTRPDVAVMVVPPAVTEAAVAECARLRIPNVWMQPGAESEAAVAACHQHGIAVVSGGPCMMVGLRTLKYQPEEP